MNACRKNSTRLTNRSVPLPGRCRGMTLLEVMIALLILMVGMLAVAGLQTMALSHNNSAYLRSQAVIQAHDLADRMYANPAGVSSGAYKVRQNSPPTCLTTATALDVVETIDCSPDEMAHFDLSDWDAVTERVLPSGAGTVTGPDGGVYTITVTWVEREHAPVDGSDGLEVTPVTKSFSFEVRPLP